MCACVCVCVGWGGDCLDKYISAATWPPKQKFLTRPLPLLLSSTKKPTNNASKLYVKIHAHTKLHQWCKPTLPKKNS